jgi:uncharacterized protein
MKIHAWQVFLLVAIVFLISSLALAAPNFPKLTGRVIDNANMLDSFSEQRITSLLSGHEDATTNQVVVVTLPNLGGYDIDTYGYQLGRHWGIGQKDKNNGVLLIVAKSERKIRIEVGYGLEGVLTDATASNIINFVIRPEFKKAKFDEGINQGVHAILEALGGEYKLVKKKKKKAEFGLFAMFLFIFVIFWYMIGVPFASRYSDKYYGGYYPGGSTGGGFSGGFSGGGGGFGGGGASGGW